LNISYILTTEKKIESTRRPARMLVLAENEEHARLLAAGSIGGWTGLIGSIRLGFIAKYLIYLNFLPVL
jgi:hypothetical protein